MQTYVDVLRHGEALGGAYYRGITDDALSERGWQQMTQRVQNFKDWDLIISSPLRRCYDFAQKLTEQRQLPCIVKAGFQEINFGSWEGKTAAQIETLEKGSLMRFYQNPTTYTPPNGESIPNFQQRIQQNWQQLLATHQGKRILLITHSGVIRSLFSIHLNIPIKNSFSIQINHASLTQFQCFHGTPDFVQLNFHLNN